MLKTETDVPRVLSKLKTFIDKIPDIDDFIAKNPNISLNLVQLIISYNPNAFTGYINATDSLLKSFESYLSTNKNDNKKQPKNRLCGHYAPKTLRA